jgi:AraC family transcriptional regulator
MPIEPIIKTSGDKKLIGKHSTMTFANNKTAELWRGFMPFRSHIQNAVSPDVISMQIYPEAFDFNPNTPFEKWASIEVSDFNNIPDGMETFVLESGTYAVFLYKGLSTDHRIFEYIFSTWLPRSEYELDNRPHFEVLGEKYKNNDPDSEEEIWIPIKPKPLI